MLDACPVHPKGTMVIPMLWRIIGYVVCMMGVKNQNHHTHPYRRQAALQRQERERFEQQRFEQLRDREPKVRREPLLLVPRFDISLERSDLWTLTETDSISH